ncbi:MAG: hypothetical protein ACO1O6_10915 [Bacteroidota bacterium]
MNFLDIHLLHRLHSLPDNAQQPVLQLNGIDVNDISVIMHLDEKFLEIDDLEALDELAGVKVVLPDSSPDSGYAILNADDDLVYELRDELFCEIALFSIYPENRRVKRHCRRGGLAAIIENDSFVLCKGERKIPLLKLPLSLGDASKTLASELLTGILAARIHKLPVRQISRALRQLLSSRKYDPGSTKLFSA